MNNIRRILLTMTKKKARARPLISFTHQNYAALGKNEEMFTSNLLFFPHQTLPVMDKPEYPTNHTTPQTRKTTTANKVWTHHKSLEKFKEIFIRVNPLFLTFILGEFFVLIVLRLFEVRKNVTKGPSRVAQLLPVVIIFLISSNVKQEVYAT